MQLFNMAVHHCDMLSAHETNIHSHLREYSANLKTYLSDQFQVSGFIKTGAGTKIILGQTTNGIENLLTNDFIILSCGCNDVGRVRLGEVFSDS
jgi:hypothetical protein